MKIDEFELFLEITQAVQIVSLHVKGDQHQIRGHFFHYLHIIFCKESYVVEITVKSYGQFDYGLIDFITKRTNLLILCSCRLF